MNKFDAPKLSQIAERAMTEHGFIPHPPAQVMREAQSAVSPAIEGGVSDLRDMPWSSIDNVESRDLDQIEVVVKIPEGYCLYVGIADVDANVSKKSDTDQFASHNTTSVYTGIQTFPMLPERFSFDLTSLVADRDRRAMIIETTIEKSGEIKNARVYPALVKNRAKLDYPSVSAWLDGKAPPPPTITSTPPLNEQLQLQSELAKILADARKRAGALDVDTAEIRPVMDESGSLTGLASHRQDRAGSIIEELMILSNRAVAQLLDSAKLSSIRRVVKQPERWTRIVSYAKEFGYVLPDVPSSASLSKFVDQMRATKPQQFSEISLAIIKLMGRGEYEAHRPGANETGHFGLAMEQYTHATAPNRRFVDLVTQRLLKSMLRKVPADYSFQELVQIAQHASEREAEAQKVERQVKKSAAAMLLANQRGREFDAIVTGASDKGTWVRIDEPAIEGKVVAGQQRLQVGQRVRVRLRDVNVDKGFIDFEIKKGTQ